MIARHQSRNLSFLFHLLERVIQAQRLPVKVGVALGAEDGVVGWCILILLAKLAVFTHQKFPSRRRFRSLLRNAFSVSRSSLIRRHRHRIRRRKIISISVFPTRRFDRRGRRKTRLDHRKKEEHQRPTSRKAKHTHRTTITANDDEYSVSRAPPGGSPK